MVKGALSRQEIKKLIEAGVVVSATDLPEQNIQPASIDLRIGFGDVLRLPAVFLPRKGEKVFDFAKKLSLKSNFDVFSITEKGMTLEAGVPYLLPLEESLSLPDDICAKANNKSTSGRINLQARLLTEHHQEFDTVPFGYKGPIYLLVVANSFPIHIKPGEVINQLRFFNTSINGSKLNYEEMKNEHETLGLVSDLEGNKKDWKDVKVIEGGIALSANLRGNIVAYRFKGTATHALRLAERNVDSRDFFEPIYSPEPDQYIVLQKGGFYILSTSEAFSVPPHLCSEMVAYSTEAGEYRSHFAGFFDPGWGYKKGEHGFAPAVLEIIAYEDMLLYHDQPVCAMNLSRMTQTPDVMYGEAGNNYHLQEGPRLSKHFALKS